MRSLFTGFWRVWGRSLSVSVSAGARFWPLFANAVMAAARARRMCLAVLIGFPVVAGWPLLAWYTRAHPGSRGSWLAMAVPWWIVLGGYCFVALVARASQAQLLRPEDTGPDVAGPDSGHDHRAVNLSGDRAIT